jgi:hypothetical protein
MIIAFFFFSYLTQLRGFVRLTFSLFSPFCCDNFDISCNQAYEMDTKRKVIQLCSLDMINRVRKDNSSLSPFP